MEALIVELERAQASIAAARRMVAELQRQPAGRPPRTRLPSPAVSTRNLREAGMTVAEAAKVLGIGEEQLRRRLRRGEIEGIPFGGRIGWRLPREYILHLGEQITAAKEGQAAARRQLIPGARPVGRPRKTARDRDAPA